MQAIVLADPERPEIALLPVAGRPLFARQVQWLRSIGCTEVAIEVGPNAAGHELGRWLADDDALGALVRQALTGQRLDPRALAARAGLSASEPLLVVPAGVIGAGDPTAGASGAASGWLRLQMTAPAALSVALPAADLALLLPEPGAARTVLVPDDRAWTVKVASHEEALAVGEAALRRGLLAPSGDDAIQVHASEREPGIWIARGARVEEGAVLEAPVLIGVDAVVHAGARVGPSAFVGDRAVVSRGAELRRTVVLPGTILGEGLRASGVVIDARGLLDLTTRQRIDLEDPLLAAPRDEAPAVGLVTRAAAASALLVFAPALLLAVTVAALFGARVVRRVPGRRGGHSVLLREGATGIALLDAAVRLLDVATGARTLVGLRPWTASRSDGVSAWLYEDASGGPYGALNIDDELTPWDAAPCERLRARLWYAHAKSVKTDLGLLLAPLRAATGARTRQSLY